MSSNQTDLAWFDIGALPVPIDIIVDARKNEHVSFRINSSRFTAHVAAGTLLNGPVIPSVQLSSLAGAPTQLTAFQALLQAIREGPRYHRKPKRSNRFRRFVNALRVADARRAGASHRDIAALLHGEGRVLAEWHGRSDSLKSQVRRMIALSEHMARGGWRHLLLHP